MFKAYIFDWDNTLIDSLGAIKAGVAGALDKFEYSGNRDSIMDSAGLSLSLREGFPIVFGDNWEQAGKQFYKTYLDNIDLIEKMAGYDQLVEYLSANAIVCGVNSNKKHTLLKQELAHFDVKSVFSKCIGAGAMESDKPHPDGALSLIEHFKNTYGIVDGICYVGDSETDIECGLRAGVSTVLIGNDALALSKKPDFHFNSLTDFLHHISLQYCCKI